MFIPPDHPALIEIALRKELIALGYTDRGLARSVAAGLLAKPRRGAYVDGPAWAALDAATRHAIRARSAVRQAAADVVISHVSALPLLDAPTWGHSLAQVHLTRPDGKAGRSEAGVRQHRGRVIDGDVIQIADVAVMSPLRTTLEVSTTSSVEACLAVLNHFLHRGDFTMEQVRERYEQGMEHWPATLTTDLVLRLGDPRIASVGETRTHWFLWRSHFPAPVPQFEVYDEGVLFAYLDFAFPELGVWLEFDGKEKYLKHRRPGETVADAVLREKARESRVVELTGWRCVRITWADLANPAALERRIRAAIAAVAASRRAS